MKIATITYVETYLVGITPDNPSGEYVVEKSYRREEYNADNKTPYKEAVANARFWKYVDFGLPEEEFQKDYKKEVRNILLGEQRGGVSWPVSQETWLTKVDAVNSQVDEMSARLWNKYH